MSTAEKLLYLQNGVFKRKEMSNGIQYYSNNSFGTFALPPDNGNYVLTKTAMSSQGAKKYLHSLPLITRFSRDRMEKRSPRLNMEPFHSSRPIRPLKESICREAESMFSMETHHPSKSLVLLSYSME